MLLLMAPFYFDDPGAANVALDYTYGDPVALTTGTNPDVSSTDQPIPDTSPAAFWGFTNPAESAFLFVEPTIIYSPSNGADLNMPPNQFIEGNDVQFDFNFRDANGAPMELPNGIADLTIKGIKLRRADGSTVIIDSTVGTVFSDPGGAADVGEYTLTLASATLTDDAGNVVGPTVAVDRFEVTARAEFEPGQFVESNVEYADVIRDPNAPIETVEPVGRPTLT